MIPILYDKNETSFTSNGLGRLRDIISCIVTEERNGIYECDFEYPVNGVHYDLIQLGRIIAVTHDDTGDVQPFDIVGFEKPIDGRVTFHAEHISYRQKFITVAPALNSYTSTMDAFSDFKDNSQPENPFTYTDPMLTGYIAAADGLPHTIREMLGGIEGSILDTFGGEYKFDKFNVELMESRGVVRDITVRYGVNMIEYTDTADSAETYSSCMPYWTDGTNTVIGNRADGTGVTPSGRIECVPLDLSDKFESQPTKAQLATEAKKYMKANRTNVTDQSIVVSFIPLNRYDTVSPEPPAPSTFATVLYDDGTLIINEDSKDRAANIQKHGPVKKEYPALDDDHDYVMTSENDQPWHDEASDIERVEKGSDVKAKSTAYWYKGLTNVKVIDITWLDTSDVTDMTEMFRGCTNLETILVSDKFVVAQVTKSSNMFTGDTKLVGGAGTTYGSYSTNKDRAQIDWNISGDLNKQGYLTLGGDYSTVRYADNTLIINEPKSQRSANIAAHGAVVQRCNPWHATLYPMQFNGASSQPWKNRGTITSVIIGSNIAPVGTPYWFANMDNVTSFDLSKLNTSNVTTFKNIFSYCTSLESVDVSHFNTSNATNTGWMFYHCDNLKTINLSSFDTANVTIMSYMFYSCAKLTTIYATSNFVVDQVTESTEMFYNDTKLVGGAGTIFNVNFIDKARAKIDGGVGDEGYFTA